MSEEFFISLLILGGFTVLISFFLGLILTIMGSVNHNEKTKKTGIKLLIGSLIITLIGFGGCLLLMGS